MSTVAAPSSPISNQPVKVLLVEDNPSDVRLISELLSEYREQFRIERQVKRLAQAEEAVEKAEVDLVLLDLSLPDSQGFETFERLLSHGRNLPILVLSGVDDESLALRMVHAGAQDYLVKGKFDAALLARAMRYAIERGAAERELAQEKNLLRALLETMPDRIYFKDHQSRFLRVNPAMAVLFKLQRPEGAIGKTDFDFFLPEHAEPAFADEQEILRTGKPMVGKVEKETLPDGRIGWALTTKVPLRDRHGRIIGTMGMSRDITRMKEAEEKLQAANAELSLALSNLKDSSEQLRAIQLQLIEAEKMKSIGRLAAGVAHEVKNPLAIINMGVDYIEGLETGDNNTKEILREMRAAVRRADNVIRGLLDFSAPRQLEVSDENLTDILSNAMQLVRGEMTGRQYKLVTDFQPGLPALRLDRIKAEQVFVNLLTNALHAMPQGGTLTVRAYAKQLTGMGENLAGSAPEAFHAGDQVVVAEIDDTGSGIPEAKLGKIFDPFYTTKPTGKGTGLGLTVTRSIIDLHGGTIEITNRPEGSARATVMFKVL